jgi:hypothetical protein
VSGARASIEAIRRHRVWYLVLLLGAAAVAGTARAAPPDSPYRPVDTIRLRGCEPSGQLAVDATTRRLFVPCSTRLAVVDLEQGRQLGDVAETRGVRGVALAPTLGRGFTSNGGANTVTIFGLQGLKSASDHPETGYKPAAIVYDPGPARVSHDERRQRQRDGDHGCRRSPARRFRWVAVPTAVTDGAGRVYVDLRDRNEIAVLDTRLLRVVRRWPVAPCRGSVSPAIDPSRAAPLPRLPERNAGCHGHRKRARGRDAWRSGTARMCCDTMPGGSGLRRQRWAPSP